MKFLSCEEIIVTNKKLDMKVKKKSRETANKTSYVEGHTLLVKWHVYILEWLVCIYLNGMCKVVKQTDSSTYI